MAKRLLSADEIIEELNRQLRQHELYQEGMAFVPYPECSSGGSMTGYSVTGPFEKTAIYSVVAHKVFREFEPKV